MQERKLRGDGFGSRSVGGLNVLANCFVDDAGSIAWKATVWRDEENQHRTYWVENGVVETITGTHMWIGNTPDTVVATDANARPIDDADRANMLEALRLLDESRMRWIAKGRPPL